MITLEQLKTAYPTHNLRLIKQVTTEASCNGKFALSELNIQESTPSINDGSKSYKYATVTFENGTVIDAIIHYNEGAELDKIKVLPYIQGYSNLNYIGLGIYVFNQSSSDVTFYTGYTGSDGCWSGNNATITSGSVRQDSIAIDISFMYKEPVINFLAGAPCYMKATETETYGMSPAQMNVLLTGYNTIYDGTQPAYDAVINTSCFISSVAPTPVGGDYMDLNVPGNSEITNATYEFVDPVAGLYYEQSQQIKINWSVTGATKNPYITKQTTFTIPAGASCFVLFTGKYVGVYCNRPGVTMVMDTLNNGAKIGTVNKTSNSGLLEVQNIFGMYEGYEPVGGTYKVQIYTPYIFIRQIYKTDSKDKLPKSGEPTYEIFKPGTSSAYVNPNDTGELASTHLLSFTSIAAMKQASDAGHSGGDI